MFIRDTVVLTGAGASWHYGFPTGDQLVGRLQTLGSRLIDYCQKARSLGPTFLPRLMEDARSPADPIGYREIQSECEQLVSKLSAGNPLVIDYFLGHNPDLERIGRFLIAWEILTAHEALNVSGLNAQRVILAEKSDKPISHLPKLSEADDWLRFFAHAISTDCKDPAQLLQNKIRFVTFNYDESIEERLTAQLSALFSDSVVQQFVEDRIIHIYGSVGRRMAGLKNFNWDPHAASQNQPIFDAVYKRSKGIRIIEPHSKPGDGAKAARAAELIANSERLFILGYGFDENNSARINLESGIRSIPVEMDRTAHTKSIFITNFMGHDRISKRAGRIALGGAELFQRQAIHYVGRRTVEMSKRDVYEALAYDFEGYDFRAI